jgi:DNA adenine methylase
MNSDSVVSPPAQAEIRLFLEKQRQKNRTSKTIVEEPHPFLKWAGGKRQLLGQIDSYLPSQIDRYLEPFVGAGALFFYLLPIDAVLMDINAELINAYRVIRDDVEKLILSLKKHKNEADYYYSIRDLDRGPNFGSFPPVEKASRTLFMNKCCFNGLYRVNSNGYFNVPFGKYENPTFCDETNLRAVSKALQIADIRLETYRSVRDIAKSGDFIYFDPPYHPLTKTANFTGYTQDDFRMEDQSNLAQLVKDLDKKGCKIMVSNSYSDFVLALYQGFNIYSLSAKRAINRDATKRGAIPEALITNY